MDKNLKDFLIKLVVFGFLLLAIRALFQVPVEYFKWKMLYENFANRVFSKGDAIKVIVFGGIIFTMYFRNALSKIEHGKFSVPKFLVFFVGSVVFVGFYYVLRYVTNINGITSGPELFLILALKTGALLFSGFFLLVGVFQVEYILKLWKYLSKPIILTSVFMVVFYVILMLFQQQWRFFSQIVADALVVFFRPFYNVTIAPGSEGSVLGVNGFSVAIGAACSGIDSMLLFFALFVSLFALDYKEIKKLPFVIALILGVIGDFLVNNLRVFLLILVGVHISPELAVGLFHTHAGWVLFILYFMFYYWLIKKFIYIKPEKK